MAKREEVTVVVLAGKPVTPALRGWLRTWPQGLVTYRESSGLVGCPESVATIRNGIVRAYLNDDAGMTPYLMMVDADAWPLADTEQIIETSLPVCGCAATGRHGGMAHPMEGEVGAHCLRIARHALAEIRDCPAFDENKGWFAFETKADGSETAMCEDGYFCWLARRAGYFPTKVGTIGHVIPMVIAPARDGDKKMRIQFPAEALHDFGHWMKELACH